MLPQRIGCHRNQISWEKSPKQICPLAPFLQHQAKDLVWPSSLFHGEQFHLIYHNRNCMIERLFLQISDKDFPPLPGLLCAQIVDRGYFFQHNFCYGNKSNSSTSSSSSLPPADTFSADIVLCTTFHLCTCIETSNHSPTRASRTVSRICLYGMHEVWQ